MRVRCLFEKHTEVPSLIEKYGYDANSVLYLTKGKEYTVYAMICASVGASEFNSVEYYIKDDLNNDISAYNALLFEIVDSKLGGDNWCFRLYGDDMKYLMGYDAFVNDLDHFDAFIDREEKERKVFDEWCDEVDRALKSVKKQ